MNLPITDYLNTDVIVIGGGTAGCFAAIAAARSGATTILIEKNGMLGGTMSSANVNFPGLFFAWGKQIIDGPCWEAIKRTEALGGAEIPHFVKKPQKHWHEQILVNRFVYTSVLDDMCREAGIDVRLHTMLAYADETEQGVSVIVTGKEGLTCIQSKIAVDATGDANLTEMLGYPCVKSALLQPATLINDLSGYCLKEVDVNMIHESTRSAIARGTLSPELTPEGLISCLHQKRITFHIHCEAASTSAGKTEIEMNARKKLMQIYTFFRSLPGLENLNVSFVAEECGIRETKRIAGLKMITEEEYLSGTVYEDAICYAFYPIDLHVMDGIRKLYLSEETVPTIPYSALIPQGSTRLLAAGRCVSSDTNANSALRVQASCMAMGQAAGCAAAIAAKRMVPISKVSYDMLCNVLRDIGAIVPIKM